MTSDDKRELIGILEQMRDLGPNDTNSGICGNLPTLKFYDELKRIFKLWPEFSGLDEFPIKSYDEKSTPCDAFYYTENMWDEFTEYGQARHRLLAFCIETLTNELNYNSEV